MLEAFRLQNLAKEIVGRSLPAVVLDEVIAKTMVRSDGDEGLRITLVLHPESVGAITGDEALQLLVDIRDGLEREGEKRLPLVEYATADDLEGPDEEV
jgi:hypothetical protein